MYKRYNEVKSTYMREVTYKDLEAFEWFGVLYEKSVDSNSLIPATVVRIEEGDLKRGSPKIGDMIARNPLDPRDLWLVSEQVFKRKFK